MPGIANKYFRIHRRAPSVCGMTSAPYALGVFRRPAAAPAGGRDGDGGEFTGLRPGDLVLTGCPAGNGMPARPAHHAQPAQPVRPAPARPC